MIRKSATFIAMLLIFASCGKKQDSSDSGSELETAPRTRHAVRPAGGVSGTRDQLRSAFENSKRMEAGEERDRTITEIAWKALEYETDLSAEAILELPAGNDGKLALITAYLRKLVEEGKSAEATAWANSLSNEWDIAFAHEKIAFLHLHAHPEQLPASSFTAAGADPVAVQVLQSWVSQKPADALAWATKLPAGEARTTGYKIIFSQWLDHDAASALSWVQSQHNPQFRKEAVSAIIGAFSEDSDPIRHSLRNSQRNSLLESTDPVLRAEIEQGIAEAIRQRVAAQPTSEPEYETPVEPQDEPVTEPPLESSPGQ